MNFEQTSKLVFGELQAVFERMHEDDIRPLAQAILQYPRIFTIGAGREGLATRSFAMRLTHLGKQSYWIWDDTTPAVCFGNLVVAACGSGDIGHINHVVRMAKDHGATIAVLSPSATGPAIEMADIVTKIPAPAYKATGEFVSSRQPMGNLFEQSLFLFYDILIMMLGHEMGVSQEEMIKRHRNVE